MAIRQVMQQPKEIDFSDIKTEVDAELAELKAQDLEDDDDETVEEHEEETEPVEEESDETGEVSEEEEAPSEDDVYASLDENEQQAWANGWRPKELFAGDAGKWVDAKTFMDRQPLFDKISVQSKTIKNQDAKIAALQKAIKTLTALQKASATKTIQDQRVAIKAQQAEAFEERDHARYEELTKELGKLDEQGKSIDNLDADIDVEPEAEAQPPKALPKSYNEFVERNKAWFNVDSRATAVANAESLKAYESTDGSHDQKLEAALKAAEKAVKETFPKYFKNPNKKLPSPVAGAKTNVTPQVKTRDTLKVKQGMTKLERQIMREVLESTGMSEADYIKQYTK